MTLPAAAATEILPPVSFIERIPPEWRGLGFGAISAVIWGLYLALARQGVSTGLNPIDIAVFRYVPAGLIMLPWLVLAWRQVAPIGLGRSLVLTALAGPLFILFGVGGYLFAPLAHGAVIQPAMVTILSMILAALFMGETPTRLRVIGVTIIVIGIAIIAGPGLFTGSGQALLGDAMFGTAGALWAVFTLFSRRWKVPPVASTAIVSVLSGAIMLPVALLTQGFDHYANLPGAVLATQIIVQGGLSGVVAVIAYSSAIRLIGATRAAIFPALVPASAILLGIPVTGELPTMLQGAGLAVVSLGLLVSIGTVRAGLRR